MQTTTTNHITTIKTEKFKTVLIKVLFKAELNRETVTSRLLLANVLRHSSKHFKSKKALSAHLEALYGASLSVSAKKQGKLHTISFYIQVANEKFLKSAPPLFVNAVKVLGEVALNPLIKNDAFDEKVVTLEKRLLKESIESIYDDKTSYALKKMVASMCASENYAVSGDGYMSDLAEINESTLVDTYRSMLENDEMNVTVLGDIEHDETIHLIKEHFKVKNNLRSTLNPVDFEEKEISGETIFKEEQLVNQTKLNMGYRTYTRVGDTDYFTLLVVNGVFGAYAHSKLFMNVREKESLCYYCTSQLENFKGLMYVYSGLDQAQVPKAIEIIDKQLKDIVSGNFTEQELTLAKKSLTNAKRESLDSASGMLSDLEMGLLLGLNADEFINKIEAVTKADVQRVAQKIKKDTVFTLEPSAEVQA